MKAILTLLVGVIVFVLAGGNVAEPQVVSPTPVHVYERVADSQAIAGTW